VMELKRRIFREVAAPASGPAILASNTPSLSETRNAEGLPSPGRFLGLHLFHPVHTMPPD